MRGVDAKDCGCPLLRGGAPRLLAAALALCMAGAAVADALSPERQREILREGLTAYDEAVAAAREDPARAAELYRKAAQSFAGLRASGLRNADVEYNLGNVYFRLGELGRAIVHYKRAERIDPAEPRLVANLRYARDRVEPRIAPSGENRLARQLLAWHYHTSLRQRVWGLGVLSGLGWLALTVWLFHRRAAYLTGGLVLVLLAAVVGASALWQLHIDAREPEAVIVVAAEYLRLARGEGADLALKQPLGAGVELRVVQQRAEWVEVRLPNGQTGWLPARSIERV